ncbi:MAG: GntR family transcriptional regulator, partial [Anaerolineaceae bacterium]|nr:GntR family transcriptional regulator [Anaerolineaceae bacterium]
MLPMEWKISRELSVTINEQIKGQIIYAISFGALQSGDPLPSVRELAGNLNVSPVTISKVYRELTQEGLLVSKPYIGVFVNGLGLSNGNKHQLASQSNLLNIFENSVRQATLMGYSFDEIHEAFHTITDQIQKQKITKQKTILVVGNTSTATASYAAEIQIMLHDLNVKVSPIIYEDLLNNEKEIFHIIEKAELVITLPEKLRQVRGILSEYPIRVVAIAFELCPDTIQKLSTIKPDQHVGIVSVYPEFIQVMVDELESYGLNIQQPKIELIQH